MKLLWIDGAAGMAGDMTVAALLDLGARREVLDTALNSLGVGSFHYHVEAGNSHGQAGLHFNVHIHDHGEHTHEHEHAGHHHDHEHPYEHAHEHGHAHAHVHRHLADIEALLKKAELSDRARDLALKTFRCVAEAEAKAHGKPIEEVHFHEVGAEDSIADIVGACALFDDLGVTDCVIEGLTEGCGTIHCAHGDLPVPVPAVLNIAAASGIPLRRCDVPTEMVTPTGIALAATLRTRSTLPSAFTVRKVGIGLGTRDLGRPNTLRAALIETEEPPERIWQIVTNLDDLTGEALGHACETLRALGARDVCCIPCTMKKGRPAIQLQILTEEALLPTLEEAILRHTSAIGLRKWPVERTIMERTTFTLPMPFGDIRIKRCTLGDIVRQTPEYDDLVAAAQRTGKSFLELYQATLAAL